MCQADFPVSTDHANVNVPQLLDRVDSLLAMVADWLAGGEAFGGDMLVPAIEDKRARLADLPPTDELQRYRMPWQLSILSREVEALAVMRSQMLNGLIPAIERELRPLEDALNMPFHPGGEGRDTLADRLDSLCDRLKSVPHVDSLRSRLQDQADQLRRLLTAERHVRCGALTPVRMMIRALRKPDMSGMDANP